MLPFLHGKVATPLVGVQSCFNAIGADEWTPTRGVATGQAQPLTYRFLIGTLYDLAGICAILKTHHYVWGQVHVTLALLPSLPEKKKVPFTQSLAGIEIVTAVC